MRGDGADGVRMETLLQVCSPHLIRTGVGCTADIRESNTWVSVMRGDDCREPGGYTVGSLVAVVGRRWSSLVVVGRGNIAKVRVSKGCRGCLNGGHRQLDGVIVEPPPVKAGVGPAWGINCS